MKELLENLKKAITNYEYCVYIGTNESIIAENIRTLNKCCKEVSKECQIMFNTIFDY